MSKNWNDAPQLFIHTVTEGGLPATLPLVRVVKAFDARFTGVLGVEFRDGKWHVPGYKCLGCGKMYFVAEQKDLRHACSREGGIISDKR